MLLRPAVQGQLVAIAIVLVVARLSVQWVGGQCQRRFNPPRYFYRQGQKRSWQGYGMLILHLLLTPLFCLVAINLLQGWFLRQGRVVGLLLVALVD